MRLLFALLTLASTAAAAEVPKLRLAEVQDITPDRYSAELTLDPAKKSFRGLVRIQVKVRKPAQSVWLNANQIMVEEASVAAGGRTSTAKAIAHGDDFLELQLPAPMEAGTAEISIRYTGVVRNGDSAGVFLTKDSGNRYILTQFESTDARDAFPCFDEPSYKTPWQLTLRIPDGLKAVCNTPADSDTADSGMRKLVFRETKPLPSYLVAFAVGPFEFVNAGVAGSKLVPVRIVTPKGRAAEAKYAAEVTATILTRLENYFGIPFPYDKSDQVAVPVTIGFGAMENPGMVTYGQNILLAKPDTDSINRQRGYAAAAAHELAHQWFGDLVTTAWWDDIWLNEAFATWMERRILADWKPEWNTRVNDVGAKLGAETQDGLMTARKIRQEIESKGDIANAFDDITYQKGASVIGMFERWMGPENFRKGVQGYLRRYSFHTATSADFLDALSTSGKDIGKPFSTFLNQPGVPVLKVALDCAKTPTLHLEQSRYLPVGSKGSTNQTWSIPVCVRYGAGANERQCTLMTQPAMDVALNAKNCPAWVNANDAAEGYYHVDYQGSLLSALAAGDVQRRLSTAERYDLIGNASAMASGGRLPAADALRLVGSFHADPSRQVLERALRLALSFDSDIVPDNLRPNYERFLRQNFLSRARELGWIAKAGEPVDVKLLRPSVLSAMATVGGDAELAAQARQLAEKWLVDRTAVSPDVAPSVVSAAAYHGDATLYRKFLAEFEKTEDRQDQQRLIAALTQFRDPAALEIGMQAVLSGNVKLADGFPLLFGGEGAPATRKLSFEFIKAHFAQIMKDNPNIFGFSFGSFLPKAGAEFCDAASRRELDEYFTPLTPRYDGMPRILAQTLEGIDLCIARTAVERPSLAEFLAKY